MKIASILFLAAVGTIHAADTNFLKELERGLQASNPATPVNGTKPKGPSPKKYDEDLKIPFKADLGCGACIRGNYIYCIPGPEGSNFTQWKAGLKAVCCTTSTCKEASDKANYNCSSQYSDQMMAKALCPFNRN